MSFWGNNLVWPIVRLDRTLRIYVVEPESYKIGPHTQVFDAVLNIFTKQSSFPVDVLEPFGQLSNPSKFIGSAKFDLITFPEAFLPVSHLITILEAVSHYESYGCVHTGLRPTEDTDNHLFAVAVLKDLVEKLHKIDKLKRADLCSFSHWLNAQDENHKFNVGCIFAIDADGALRVCLHAKCIRSKYEASPIADKSMKDSNLLSVVTLRPKNTRFLPVVIQPLICSDALTLGRDNGECGPLEAVKVYADCLGATPPDHVDVVSVATCTPQPKGSVRSGPLPMMWHQEFRRAFLEAAEKDVFSRHRFASFVLANFRTLDEHGNTPGGLSGVFLPVPLNRLGKFPPFVTVTAWGREKNSAGDNMWSKPEHYEETAENWSTLGHITSLSPTYQSNNTVARLFGFTVLRLPRDLSRWETPPNVDSCELRLARQTADKSSVSFFESAAR